MKLTLGFSPCPNDTFIFDALVNKKIDTGDFDFSVYMEDVQTLNQWALAGKLDITKISYGVYPRLIPHYSLLDAGGALGKGVGPLLVAKKNFPAAEVNGCTIAIPGKDTTAHLLFSLAFPGAQKKEFMIFSAIETAVLRGTVDCGVIIHENRFTYAAKGLIKIMDLGEYWEEKTGYPIPLGGIVMHRREDQGLQMQISALIRQSVEYALARYPTLSDYVRRHAQEMDEKVMRQHIDLYVNDFSIGLGDLGRHAIARLMAVYQSLNPGVIVSSASRPI